ncbi:hypothetical protein J0S82_012300, partial [Galemys pyrenaicus]
HGPTSSSWKRTRRMACWHTHSSPSWGCGLSAMDGSAGAQNNAVLALGRQVHYMISGMPQPCLLELGISNSCCPGIPLGLGHPCCFAWQSRRSPL